MGPSMRSSRSRRKNATKFEDVNKENQGTSRVLRSGRSVQSCPSENEKPTKHNVTINRRKAKPEASVGVSTPRPLGNRKHLMVTSTPNVAAFQPPDFPCSVSSNLPEPSLLQKKAESMFPRQYVARPKRRGLILTVKKRSRKTSKADAVQHEVLESNPLPKAKRVFKETADFFGLAEVSSNSPSPPPQMVTNVQRTFKPPARIKGGSETAMKGKKRNKIQPDGNSEEFNRWMNEFNNELLEVENFEFKIVQPAAAPQ